MPKPGKVWSDTASNAIFSMAAIYGKLPKCVANLAKENGEAELDRLTEEIYKQEKLSEKSTEWLQKELKHDNKAPEIKLSKAAEKALQSIVKPEPEKKGLNSVEEIRKEAGFDENVIEKKNTIKDRASVFEPKGHSI